MMSNEGSQNSLRKTLGALKDTTTVSLAKINSDYKELDIAIVKATNHHERPAQERHMKAVFAAISATRPRADVAYCIHALARRLSKTHNWAVALKTLIVIHRALREVDPTFQEQVIKYGRSQKHILNLARFKDDSSPSAWEYSGWVRAYALFLEERLECFKVVKYDIQDYRLVRTTELNTPELLEQLPAFQNLLYRVLGCQPQGAAAHNFIIQLALSMVASESIKVYYAISDGSMNLVDKFFEMQKPDALKALDIYRRAGLQAERLSKFYEICKTLDVGRGERYIKIEQPPASFIQAMEEYVRDSPHKDMSDGTIEAILTIEYKNSSEEGEEECLQSPPPQEPEPESEPVKLEASVSETASHDLLGLHELSPAASEFEQNNAMALAILPLGDPQKAGPTGPNVANGITGWELALVTAPSSNKTAPAAGKLAGGMDKFTLDSLYDEAIRRSNPNSSYNPWEQTVTGSPDPFHASNAVAAPPMATVHHSFLPHQQMRAMGPQQTGPQQTGPQQTGDLFANTYGPTVQPYGQNFPVQAYSHPYSGLI